MRIKKILLTILTLALTASVFVCGKAFAQAAEPWNVEADIVYEKSVYHYNLKDRINPASQNVEARGFYLSCNGKKKLAENLLEQGLQPEAVYEYILPSFKEMLRFFSFVNVEKKDAEVSFDSNGFHYTEGRNGVEVDAKSLFETLLNTKGAKTTVKLPLTVYKAVSAQDLKQNTVKKASFTTRFASSSANRCFNIAKATKAICGVTVENGEVFSFNKIVGPRTEDAGYKQAKIILDGMYTDGVGGGVCQVSTTLYNALLLAEILPKASAHTLISSYVSAGFDAMVSYGGADLSFVNDTGYPIYIEGRTNLQNKTVTFTVYGKPNCYRVVRESVETRQPCNTVEIFDSVKYPELVYTDQIKIIIAGSDGVKSSSYLNYYDGNKLVQRKLIRQNSYKMVNRVIARGKAERVELDEAQ